LFSINWTSYDSTATDVNGITLGKNGTLWLAQYTNEPSIFGLALNNINIDGTLINQQNLEGIIGLGFNIDFDSSDYLWYADSTNTRFVKMDTSMNIQSQFNTAGLAPYTTPYGLAVGNDGTLWVVCDSGGSNFKIFNLQTNGSIISSFLPSAFDATESSIFGISMASNGTLWIPGQTNHKFYNVTTSGVSISSHSYRTFVCSTLNVNCMHCV
jgi:DNA-binding beta-propeller fold protein YncE